MAEAKYPFKNLVFEGGGVKGIAYVGALRELEKRDVVPNITRVGGTSAGAINAVLMTLGYTLAEMEEILKNLNFRNFMDDSWGVMRDVKRVTEDFGWHKGEFFRDWISELIAEKTGSRNTTFQGLQKRDMRDLYLVGTNLSTGFSEVFSPEHTPRMRVADAVRISMSIPLFFAAVRNVRSDVYVDGGMIQNYPIKLFDRTKYIAKKEQKDNALPRDYYDDNENKSRPKSSSPYVFNRQTLGFRLDDSKKISVFRDGDEPTSRDIDDFFDYTMALFGTLLNVQDSYHLHSDDWERTVYIDTIGVKTTDFDVDGATKKRLVKEGEKGVKNYFHWLHKQGF